MLNNPCKILIIDDVSNNIKIVGNILKTEDYKLFFATSGKDALKKVKINHFDLILLDVMMPEMDGFEVCRRLKELPDTSEIPIIFLTAKTDTESIIKGFEMGAVDYVTKPFNASELLARVKIHLELKKSKQKLKEALAVKNKFFSIIAHDIRSPLSTLLGFSEILSSNFDALPEKKKRDLSNRIAGSTKLLYNLIINLLEWSKVQINRINYRPELFNLKSMIRTNMSLLDDSAQEKQINLTLNVEEELNVYADPNMIKIVIRNLLTNAIKFTPDHGAVTITAHKKDDVVEIIVADNGIGMDEETIRKLFRIDVHHTTRGTNDEKGTGLGLILCKEFIERNSGEIQVESTKGKGSSFTFTLPNTMDN